MDLQVLPSEKYICDLERSVPLQFFSKSGAYLVPKRLDSRTQEKKMFYSFDIVFAEIT